MKVKNTSAALASGSRRGKKNTKLIITDYRRLTPLGVNVLPQGDVTKARHNKDVSKAQCSFQKLPRWRIVFSLFLKNRNICQSGGDIFCRDDFVFELC